MLLLGFPLDAVFIGLGPFVVAVDALLQQFQLLGVAGRAQALAGIAPPQGVAMNAQLMPQPRSRRVRETYSRFIPWNGKPKRLSISPYHCSTTDGGATTTTTRCTF
jgi:hypothetical protein